MGRGQRKAGAQSEKKHGTSQRTKQAGHGAAWAGWAVQAPALAGRRRRGDAKRRRSRKQQCPRAHDPSRPPQKRPFSTSSELGQVGNERLHLGHELFCVGRRAQGVIPSLDNECDRFRRRRRRRRRRRCRRLTSECMQYLLYPGPFVRDRDITPLA